MENLIKNQHEKVDNLHIEGYRIIQNSMEFRYGMDAVLLAWYAEKKIKKQVKILDFGTGTGIIPILLAAQEKDYHIDAIEIQEYYGDLAKRNVQLNHLDDYIKVFLADIKHLPREIERNSYDVVVSNPPYMKGGLINAVKSNAIARHEIALSLEELVVSSKEVLKDKGKLILIHRAHRLVDIFYNMRIHSIEPKSMQLISPKKSKEANLVLIEGIKNGKPQLTIEKPLTIYSDDGSYSQSIMEIYQKGKK